jgi:hypothetical protein
VAGGEPRTRNTTFVAVTRPDAATATQTFTFSAGHRLSVLQGEDALYEA